MPTYTFSLYEDDPFFILSQSVGGTATWSGATAATGTAIVTDNETGGEDQFLSDGDGATADITFGGSTLTGISIFASESWTVRDTVSGEEFQVTTFAYNDGSGTVYRTLSARPLVNGRTYETISYDTTPTTGEGTSFDYSAYSELPLSDDIVSGTAGDDVIDTNYTGDIDQIDNQDNDSAGTPVSQELNWNDYADGTDLSGGITQDTGDIDVTLSTTGPASAVIEANTSDTIYTQTGEPFASQSSLFLNNPGDPQDIVVTLDFAASSGATGIRDEVQNVSFRISDIDQITSGGNNFQDLILVQAFDADGNAVDVTITIPPGSDETISDGNDGNVAGTVVAGPSSNNPDQEAGSVLFEIDGPVSEIVITYDNGGNTNQFTWLSDLHFETIPLGSDADSVEAGAGDDSVLAGLDSDTVLGEAGNDTLDGEEGDDSLLGGTGDDSLIGGEGADTLEGGADDDRLEGGSGDDSLVGGAGSDTLIGGAGADDLQGGAGDDDIAVGGADVASGGTGDDVFTLDGTDPATDVNATVSGGSDGTDGNPDGPENGDAGDILDLSDQTADLDVLYATDPEDGTVNGLDADGAADITFDEIELIRTGSGDDDVDATSATGGINIETGDGADDVTGGSGDDSVVGGAGSDTLDGGAGDDTLIGGAGDDVLIAGNSGSGGDSLDGGAGNDTLTDSFNNSTLIGGDDADIINVGFGNSSVVGGEGGTDTDTLSFAVADDAVSITFDGDEQGTYDDLTDPDGGTFEEIEVFELTSEDDLVDGTASNASMTVFAGAGDDSITGGSADDSIGGGAGSDTISGGPGADTLDGGGDDDNITMDAGDLALGGDGDDIFTVDPAVSGTAPITVIGGEGDEGATNDPTNNGGGAVGDLLDLRGLDVRAITYDPSDPEAGTAIIRTLDGDLITLTFSEIETVLSDPLPNEIVEGEDFAELMTPGYDDGNAPTDSGGDIIDGFDGPNDSIQGNGGDDTIDAGIGDDTVDGGADADIITGGLGADILDGGSGDDDIAVGGADTASGGSGDDVFTIDATDTAPDVAVVLDGGTDGTDGNPDDGANGDVGDSLDLSDQTADLTVDFTTDPEDGAVDGLDADGSTDITFTEIEAVATGSGVDTVDASTATGGGINVATNGGADVVTGGAGDDSVLAGSGADSVSGGAGADTLIGGSGADTLIGGAGADILEGGSGADSLEVGSGDDATGGGGDDTFTIDPGALSGSGTIDIDGGGTGSGDNDTLFFNGQLVGGSLVTNPDPTDAGAFTGTATLLDGTTVTFSGIETIICFVSGTRIATPYGPRRVEDLREGDLVCTRDNGLRPIVWAGCRHVAARGDQAPIRIKAGHHGARQDVYVSPQHRILVTGWRAELFFGEREVLVPAKALVDDHSVVWNRHVGLASYHHILLDEHAIVEAEGLLSESFLPGNEAMDGLDPADRSRLFDVCPELRGGAALRPARKLLQAQAARCLVEG